MYILSGSDTTDQLPVQWLQLNWLGCSETFGTAHDSPFALVEHFAANKYFHALPGYYKDVVTGLWNCDTENAEFRLLMESIWTCSQ